MIDEYAYLSLFARAIAQDAGLATWAAINYSPATQVAVYMNVDPDNLPGEADCPLVVIRPEGFGTGREVADETAAFLVHCMLYDETTNTNPGADNITEYTGVENICDFRRRVAAVMAACSLGDGEIRVVGGDYDTISDFPFFEAVMRVEITEPATVDDPLTL